VLFCVFVGPRLHGVVVLGCVLLLFLTLWALSKASWTEAGIIPRYAFQRLQQDYDRLPLLPKHVRVPVPPAMLQAQAQAQQAGAASSAGANRGHGGGGGGDALVEPHGPEVETAPFEIDPLTGEKTLLKFCSTCCIYRPARAKHCRDCDNCVEEFDHRQFFLRICASHAARWLLTRDCILGYRLFLCPVPAGFFFCRFCSDCPWVCNCVGKRNYRYFVGFVLCVTLLTTYVCACSLALLITETSSSSFAEAISSQPVAACLAMFTLMLGWCLCSLSWYHVWLIGQDLTTNEHIKLQRGELEPRAASAAGAAARRREQSAHGHGHRGADEDRLRTLAAEDEDIELGGRGQSGSGSGNSRSSHSSSHSGALHDEDDGPHAEQHHHLHPPPRTCLGRIWRFFTRPDARSYFALRAPLGSSVFVRTMVPVAVAAGGEAAAAAAPRGGQFPVAYPMRGAGVGGQHAQQPQPSPPRHAEEEFDMAAQQEPSVSQRSVDSRIEAHPARSSSQPMMHMQTLASGAAVPPMHRALQAGEEEPIQYDVAEGPQVDDDEDQGEQMQFVQHQQQLQQQGRTQGL
jgi:hypothetical protein